MHRVWSRYDQACGLLEVRKSHILKKLAALESHEPPPTLVEEQEVILVGKLESWCIHCQHFLSSLTLSLCASVPLLPHTPFHSAPFYSLLSVCMLPFDYHFLLSTGLFFLSLLQLEGGRSHWQRWSRSWTSTKCTPRIHWGDFIYTQSFEKWANKIHR